MKKLLFLLLIMPIFFGCILSDKGHNSILIVNNSENDIYVVHENDYPDTIFHHRWMGISDNEYQTKVKANSSSDGPLCLYWDIWETEFAYKTIIPSDTLIVFILNVDSIDLWENEKLSPKKEQNPNNAVLKRYDLSLNDLKKMNWTITYP